MIKSLSNTSGRLSQTGKLRLLISAYITGIVITEIIAIYSGPLIALAVHSILLIVLTLHAADTEQLYRSTLLPLALYPLMRVTSLGLPAGDMPVLFQYVTVSLPLWIGIFMISRIGGLTLVSLKMGVNIKQIHWQLLFCLVGWPMGLLGTLIMRPEPVISSPTLPHMTLGIIVITLFSSSVEEVFFRGVLQTALYRSLGNYGVFCASILFFTAYLGSLSIAYALIMGVLGLLFAWFVHRTDSLWGVLLAHSLFKCGMLVIWPFFT
ncbi:MAG: CPBP family intramembrane metalloprotease [Anaerolineae bacterium]|nr:CPBP family intramembrane metalloprotease [Anaerolineae bacterium]